MYNFEYDYTICPDNSVAKFKEACELIESAFPKHCKKKLLVDVDGSTIQKYEYEGKVAVVYDDYDVGAVFVKSEINLDKIFA